MLSPGHQPMDIVAGELLQLLTDESSTSIPHELRDQLLAAVADAPIQEIDRSLYRLWLLMRHISREYCWTSVAASRKDDAAVRSEIRQFLTQRDAERRRGRELAEQQMPSLLAGGLNRLRQCLLGPDELSREITQLSATLHGGTDPLTHYLNYPKAYMDDSWFPVGWVDQTDRFDRARYLLDRLAVTTHCRIGDSPVFWAVLGPIYDALNPADPEGFEDRITQGENWLLRSLVNQGRADLWDYWMLFRRQETDEGVATFDRMLDYVEHAPWRELEAFFSALENVNSDALPLEHLLPDAGKLWTRIIRRAQVQPVTVVDTVVDVVDGYSLQLLGRGGLYFWETSLRHRGPSIALAAFGLALEGDVMLSFHDFEIPAFLAFWAAARDAAEEHHWKFAMCCFERAVLDVRIFASSIMTGRWREEIDVFTYDLHFVNDLLDRLDGESTERLKIVLYSAIDALQAANVPVESTLRLKLEHLGHRLHVDRLADSVRLSLTIGPSLWRALDPNTREILLDAEAFWRTRSFSAVGNYYRRALEHEWRIRLAAGLRSLDPELSFDPAVGEMLHVIQRCTKSIGHALLTKVLSRKSELLNPLFVKRALGLVEFLNRASHAVGFDQADCASLRMVLLDQGMLKDLFEAVRRKDEDD